MSENQRIDLVVRVFTLMSRGRDPAPIIWHFCLQTFWIKTSSKFPNDELNIFCALWEIQIFFKMSQNLRLLCGIISTYIPSVAWCFGSCMFPKLLKYAWCSGSSHSPKQAGWLEIQNCPIVWCDFGDEGPIPVMNVTNNVKHDVKI